MQAPVSTTTAAVEYIMSDTILRVADMHDRLKTLEAGLSVLPEIRLMLSTISSAQSTIAHSAESMADTFKQAEHRYADMHDSYKHMSEVLSGKELVPLKTHYWTVLVALAPTVLISVLMVLFTLYYTNQSLQASFKETKIEIKQALEETKEVVAEAGFDGRKKQEEK